MTDRVAAPPRLPFLRTHTTRTVLLALRALGPGGETYGQKLAAEHGMNPNVARGILVRLLLAGWCADRWEDEAEAEADPQPDGRYRPRRRYFRLTDEGRAGLNDRGTRAWLAKRT